MYYFGLILSIITVCYNAKEDLAQTVDSVLSQTWRNFEYIVVDGDSTDGTKEYLEQLRPSFKEKNITLRYVSEKDEGIYDAMNKGTLMATGHWVMYLNAGDLFVNASVLRNIFADDPDTQILYGDTLCTYQGQVKRYPAKPLSTLPRQMAFCHQSALIERDVALRFPYDTSYKICADHHFFLKAYSKGLAFEYCELPIAVYEISGVSDRNKWQAHKEQLRMQKELGELSITPKWILLELVFFIKLGLKTILGQAFIDKVRKKRLS